MRVSWHVAVVTELVKCLVDHQNKVLPINAKYTAN